MPRNVSQESDKADQFIESINEAHNAYYASPSFKNNPPDVTQCLEAMNGVSMLVGTSAILQGFYTQQLIDSLEK